MKKTQIRRGLTYLALATVLGLATVGLTQCRLVDDSVTGVDLRASTGLSAKSECKKQCKERKKQCERNEKARHKAEQRVCKDLEDSSARKACKKAESRKHKDSKEACKDEEKKCKNGCYNEGSGSAGR